MNIFYLDADPRVAARMMCDKHVVKMILESAQLLSTAHHELGTANENMYKPTHKNHPSAVWARASYENYVWLAEHALALCDEYNIRYGKVHKTEHMLVNDLFDPPDNIPRLGFTEPPKCMPDEFKVKDVVESYRRYYVGAKARFAKWKLGNEPVWFTMGANA